MKLNHAKKKREVVKLLCDSAEKHFIENKTRPGCIAGIWEPIREQAMAEAIRAISQGYTFSKTMYPIMQASFTREIFLSGVAKRFIERAEIHNLWYN